MQIHLFSILSPENYHSVTPTDLKQLLNKHYFSGYFLMSNVHDEIRVKLRDARLYAFLFLQ